MMSFVSTFRTGVAALAAVAFMAAPASAGGLFDTDPAPGGFYVSGFGGINFGSDADFEGVQTPDAGVPGVAGANALVDVDFSSSRAFGGAIGVQLPFRYWKYFHPRLELEGGTFRQNVDGGSFNGGTQTFGGHISGTTILLNNYSDIIFSENQTIVPYIGGGIGVVFIDSNITYFPGTASAPTFAVSGDDTALYGTIAAGLSVRFTQKLELYTEARYNRATSVQLERTFVADGSGGFNADVQDSLNSVSVLGGIRFRF